MVAGPPRREVAVPIAISRIAGGRALRPVWENELGGLTFEIDGGASCAFAKWAPTGSGIDLDAEVARLTWAVHFTPVPRVIEHGEDADGSWLVTAGVLGETAVSDRWRAEPATAVAAIGRALRSLHDTLPVEDCPFSWSADDRVADAERRAAAGQIDPTRWSPEHRGFALADALARIRDIPPVAYRVVCHGDACAPNTLLGDNGQRTGNVDLGALGIADSWADLAVATWSCDWNYGPGWQDHLLDAYGVERDPERIAFYRLLWDLGP